jgi:hypothetical protein
MTVQELADAGVVNVQLILAVGEVPAGTATNEFHGILNITDEMLQGFTFVNIDENMMATYTV